MSITIAELIMRLGLSALLGSAIGYERELRERPAGLRTHFLVSLASATFMLVSSQFPFPQHYELAGDGFLRADVGRIASNVVVGIGFLGGGAILHSGLPSRGATTAASLWMVAAVWVWLGRWSLCPGDRFRIDRSLRLDRPTFPRGQFQERAQPGAHRYAGRFPVASSIADGPDTYRGQGERRRLLA